MKSDEELGAEVARALFGGQTEQPEPETQDAGVNGGEIAALAGTDAMHHALAEALGIVGGPPDPEPSAPSGAEQTPDFDGGAREPAPGPTDPVADHDALVVALAASLARGDGSGW